MKIVEKLERHEAVLSVVGLGYVGLPLAIAFSKKVRVLGFDVNPEKVRRYQAGEDPTHEVGDAAVKESFEKVRDVDAIILAVAHGAFRALTLQELDALFLDTPNDKKIIVDVRSMLDKNTLEKEGYRFWRL